MALNAGHTYREQAGADAHGQRLAAYLARRHEHSTEAVWIARIERGEVDVEGVTVRADRPLQPGQHVTWRRPPWDEPTVPLQFELIHEDEAIVAVAKPSGLPTMPAGGFVEHTLLAIVRARFTGAVPMHRLGRGTSGLVLFARTEPARAALQRDWREHRVRKSYLALASGIVTTDSFTITAPIGPVPHPALGTLFAADPHGKPSRSIARVLERRESSTLLEVEIETGRPHQIRIHLGWAGHPLVGDPLFGPGGTPLPHVTTLPGDAGYHLHAHRLAFEHPTTGRPLELIAPPPGPLTERPVRGMSGS